MCEAFEKLAEKVADERAEQVTNKYIKAIMKSAKCSLEEALDMLKLQGKSAQCMRKCLKSNNITVGVAASAFSL